MKLTALADVNDTPEPEKMAIAKFLTVCLPASAPHVNCFSPWNWTDNRGRCVAHIDRLRPLSTHLFRRRG